MQKDSTNNTGRLLTKVEANTLKTLTTSNSITIEEQNKIMLWGQENQQGSGSSSYYLHYWLGSSYSIGGVCGGLGLDRAFGGNSFDYIYNTCGVRPVITVYKSSVS